MTESPEKTDGYEGTEIAIIGMAGRYPGATNLDQFWSNLVQGVESISTFTEDEVLAAGVDPQLLSDPFYVKAGGILDNVEEFDADFFGFYPKEAEIIDPQQRVFLEVVWEALENAGYDPSDYPGWIGVFAGSGMSTYLLNNLITNPELMDSVHGYQVMISNDKDFLPTRVSYKLNLRGPSVNVQTACSTSLVATHLACQSLINYQCDIAIAGGISIRFPQKQGYLYQEGGIASPDGHCRAFDEDANGTVSGNGVGVVVLKRLTDAIADGDFIYSVIKGTAINNDGSLKVGYTAPSVEGQAEVIAMAQAVANVDPDTISYIETHGTGTSLGDPIEISALTKVFRNSTDRIGFCAIGSVKTNIGHLDAAAGVTGLIKTAMALSKKQIPPSINFNKPNPKIDFGNSPFIVNTSLRNWEAEHGKLRAGVSSFGIGGTNAHAILEDAPDFGISGESRKWQMVMLSARSQESLNKLSQDFQQYLEEQDGIKLPDVAYTLHVGRRNFQNRKVIIATDIQETIRILKEKDPENTLISEIDEIKPEIVFMFSGQGAQYVNMARGVYDSELVFKENVDACCQILKPYLDLDLRDVVYPDPSISKDDEDRLNEKLRNTYLAQPALFVIEYSMAQLFISWGIEPSAMIGHSIGEFVAAILAGVFTLEDALAIVAYRGMLMQSLPKGSMVSLSLSEAEASRYLFGNLTIATVNGPTLCVISGNDEEINELIENLKREGIEYRRLKTSHAFHSYMMDPILDDFKNRLSRVSLGEPKLRFISNLTGTWIKPEEAMSTNYWTQHLRQTVRFADGINELIMDPSVIFLEVGPGRSLTVFVKNHPESKKNRSVLSSIRHPQDQQDDEKFLLNCLSKLWLSGVKIDWFGFYKGEKRRRLPIPSTPFEHGKYWIDAPLLTYNNSIARRSNDKKKDIADWFYIPSWKRTPLNSGKEISGLLRRDQKWLVITNGVSSDDQINLVRQVTNKLQELNQDVIVGYSNNSFEEIGIRKYKLKSEDHDGFVDLIEYLGSLDWIPDQVIAFCPSVREMAPDGNYSILQPPVEEGFLRFVFLAKRLANITTKGRIVINIVANGLYRVIGTEKIEPENAMLSALSLVIPQEHANLTSQVFDIDDNWSGYKKTDAFITSLISDFLRLDTYPNIVYRGENRWLPEYIPANDWIFPSPRGYLEKKGRYVITGGLGRIGLHYANYLATKYQAKVILIDQIKLPERDQWQALLQKQELDTPTHSRLLTLTDILASGGDLEIFEADVSDYSQLKQALSKAEETCGGIDGIIHSAGLTSISSMVMLQELTKEDCKLHFSPKVYGLLNIANILVDDPKIREGLKFVLLQSSLSTILGGIGLTAYSAANLFMDSFISVANEKFDFPWITINWDGWRFDDKNKNEQSKKVPKGLGDSTIELSLYPQEGIEVLESILASEGITHIIVSTGDLQERIKKWLHHGELESGKLALAEEQKKKGHSRPKLKTLYVEPRNNVEKELEILWENVLGIEKIGVYDDFFELGGHSLLATQLVTRIRDLYHKEFPLRNLFENPTISGLSEIILEEDGDEPRSQKPTLERISRDEPVPLSFGQQRLWFLDQLTPNSSLYNNFAAIRITGDLNISLFNRCVQEIIKRHESMRTIFKEINDQPQQIILHELTITPDILDLLSLDEIDQQQEIKRLAIEESQIPFNLQEGPLLRIKYLKTRIDEHVVFITTHHIISDGWSVNILVYEIGILYSNYLQSKKPDLPELEFQYRDYSTWQQKWLSGGVLDKQLNYWKSKLDGLSPTLELLTDHPRPLLQTANGSNLWFELPEDLTKNLYQFSRDEGVTLFMTLLTALDILLFRYTHQENFAVGTPIANRNLVEIEKMIGFFLNILVLRSEINGNPSIHELLQEVKEVALEAYANQDLPFEILVDELQHDRDMSRSPLFQVIFDLQDARKQKFNLPELEVEQYKVDIGTAKYDIALSMEEHGDIINGYFNFNTDLFDPGTIQQMCRHFIRILQIMVENPSVQVSDFSLMDDLEHDYIVRGLNNNWIELNDYISVINLFADQVKQSGENQAIIDGKKRYTYRELDSLSSQLSSILIDNGAGDGVVIGLLLERSYQAIFSILGIWKANSIYLPLDPEAPLERLNYILEDANTKIIVTQAGVIKNLPAEVMAVINKRKVIVLEDTQISLGQSKANPSIGVNEPDSVAYIIYTSGSTGKPKGVMVSHRALSDHCRVVTDVFGIRNTDRVLQFSAYSFDQSIEQIIVPLVNGGELFLRGNEIWNPEEFLEVILENQISVVNIQPAYWQLWSQAMVNKSERDIDSRLKLVIIGGDVVLPEHIRLWWNTPLKSVRLLNAYGPTETTITSSVYEIRFNPDREVSFSRVPIGKPLPNRKYYILDKHLKPVPFRVSGELFIGGKCLSNGYLNQSDLTNKSFIVNPFLGNEIDAEHERLMYRTGDMVRYLPDGNVEFMGRLDSQIKIRGFRIELGEIETVISTLPMVKEAVAIATKRIRDGYQTEPASELTEKRLLAFITPKEGLSNKDIDPNNIKQLLREKLPGYMIPSSIVIMDKLPLLASGKVDRKALERIDIDQNELLVKGVEYIAPRTPVEIEIANIWSDILGKEKVGIQENFFELGGHSLLAAQVVSRIKRAYPIDLPLRTLFEAPTIEALSIHIAQSLAIEAMDEGNDDIEGFLQELEQMSDEDINKLLNRGHNW